MLNIKICDLLLNFNFYFLDNVETRDPAELQFFSEGNIEDTAVIVIWTAIKCTFSVFFLTIRIFFFTHLVVRELVAFFHLCENDAEEKYLLFYHIFLKSITINQVSLFYEADAFSWIGKRKWEPPLSPPSSFFYLLSNAINRIHRQVVSHLTPLLSHFNPHLPLSRVTNRLYPEFKI